MKDAQAEADAHPARRTTLTRRVTRSRDHAPSPAGCCCCRRRCCSRSSRTYPVVATHRRQLLLDPAGRQARPRFVGLDNYQAMLADDPVFWKSLWQQRLVRARHHPAVDRAGPGDGAWVNAAMRGRGLLRLAYFTPTVLPMIAVANIWLFFYTPQYGLLEQLTRLFGSPAHNWLGSPDTVLGCVIVVAIWKEAGFFMIFYLAALQPISPALARGRGARGRVALATIFRRITLPAADADHAVRAGQRGDQLLPPGRPHRRDDPRRARQRHLAAALLHLRGRLQLLGHGLCGDADRACCWCCSRLVAIGAVRASSSAGRTTNEPRSTSRHAARSAARSRRVARVAAGHAAGSCRCAYAVWTAFHPPEYSTRFELIAPLTLDEFRRAPGRPRRSRATSSTPSCW